MAKRPIECTVKKIVKVIVKGGYNDTIITQLGIIMEQAITGVYTQEELEEYVPDVSEYSLEEIKDLIELLGVALKKEIHEKNHTYLETLRIIVAMDEINQTKELETWEKKDDKIRFCN